MNKAEEKRARLLAQHPDIEFISGKGKKVKLTFEVNEYRAYFFDDLKNEWYSAMLGSSKPDSLVEYIKAKF